MGSRRAQEMLSRANHFGKSNNFLVPLRDGTVYPTIVVGQEDFFHDSHSTILWINKNGIAVRLCNFFLHRYVERIEPSLIINSINRNPLSNILNRDKYIENVRKLGRGGFSFFLYRML